MSPEEQARAMLAAELTPNSPAHRSVLRGPPYPSGNVTIGQAVRALIKALSCEEQVRAEERWRPMPEAPRDGSYILAIVAPNRGRHLEHQAGRMFAIRHEGLTEPSGYDMGWAVYPGFGGASDHDFACWRPLPAPPSLRASGHEGGGNG